MTVMSLVGCVDDEQRPLQMLRMLNEHADGLTSIDFRELFPARYSRQRVQSQVGQLLRRMERDGQITRSPERRRYPPGAVKKLQPSQVWQITGKGRAVVLYADAAPERERIAAERLAALEAATVERRQALLDAAAAYSRDTPRGERRVVAGRLRDLGCNLEEIGQIFGVSREMIRQDLLPFTPQPPRARRLPGARFMGCYVRSGLLVIKVGARSIYLTRPEALELAKVIGDWDESQL